MERQFRKYFEDAQRSPGVTGEMLLQWLERRLDNVIFRLGFSESRSQGRQLVLHGHFTVNGRPVNIPSFSVKPSDSINWKPKEVQPDFVKVMTADLPKRPVPEWLALDVNKLEGKVLSLPQLSEIDTKIDTRLIVEYYSK
jgi:small subunit ribosomal protein S4